jgi:predicted hydrocarbon binding protein
MATKLKRRPRTAPRRQRQRKLLSHMKDVPTHASSNYREFLLTRILQGTDRRTYPLSIEFLYTLCSSSQSLNKISYNAGISLGRLLYRNKKPSPHTKTLFRNEYLYLLADFLEAAGIGRATFHPTSHGTLVRVYRESAVRTGERIHHFEAGIVAGFLGAAGANLPYVREAQCTSEGASHCEYVSMPMAIKTEDSVSPGLEMLQRLASEIAAAHQRG